MNKEIKEFLKNKNEKVLILDRLPDSDVISQWKSVRSPIRPPINFIIITLFKLCPSMKLKRFIFTRILGMKIGKNVGIAPSNFDSVFPELISIGDNSIIGNKVHIMCHEFSQNKIRLGKVEIGKNVLIGGFSVIRSGVKIGDNSTVAMCSFVNKDVPTNEIWGGVPAKKIKKLKELT